MQQIDSIVYVVEETLKGFFYLKFKKFNVFLGNTVRLLSQRRKENLSLDLPKVRRNKFIEILAINSGCLNHCTYCKTKQARGDLRSFAMEALVERAKQSFNEGCREIWLTSEDLGAYGRDIGLVLFCFYSIFKNFLGVARFVERVGQSDSRRLHDETWHDK